MHLTRCHVTDHPRVVRTVLSHFQLLLAVGAAALRAQTRSVDLGFLDDTVYQTGTFTNAQPAVEYRFQLRVPGTSVLVYVQDFGGRIIDQATLYGPDGRVKAESLGRIGAQMGAANLTTGAHRLLIRSSKDNHQYGVTIEPRLPNLPPDPGNDFTLALDLGALNERGTTYFHQVGLGDSADFYRFQLPFAQNQLEASLLRTRRDGVFLEIYALAGTQARLVGRASASGFDTPVLNERLPGGTYFARLTAPFPAGTGPVTTSYTLSLRSIEARPDPGGNLQTPFVIPAIPTPRPIAESVHPALDPVDAYRFTVPVASAPVRVVARSRNADFALYLIDRNGNVIASDTRRGVAVKAIARTLARGPYLAMVMALGDTRADYEIGIEAQLPVVQPVRVFWRGQYWDNHSGTTTVSPRVVPVAGLISVTSTTMPFAGPGTTVQVWFERVGCGVPPCSVQSPNVTITGPGSLTAQGPSLASHRNVDWAVYVVTFTAGAPNDLAFPGMVAVQ
jgi:hypothetical protein